MLWDLLLWLLGKAKNMSAIYLLRRVLEEGQKGRQERGVEVKGDQLQTELRQLHKVATIA